VILPLFLRPSDRAAAIAALRIAALGGSRIVAVPIHRGGEGRRLADREQGLARLAAEAGVALEFVRFARAEMPRSPPEIGRAIVEIAGKHRAGGIVLPVEPDPFSRQPLGRVAAHLAASAPTRLVLVRTPPGLEEAWPRMERILIPVLEAFHPEPFELADLLGAVRSIPDVGIVVARVVRIPPIVPLYATYTPESLVDVEKERALLRRLMRGRTRAGEPRILLVRDVSRDLKDFARERKSEAIVLWGDRQRAPRFVSRSEEGLLEDPPCTVLVVLPGQGESTAEDHGSS